MTAEGPASVSVRRLLRKRASGRGEDFQRVLARYAMERFLYRLSINEHSDRFVLKGAMLFALWTDVLEHRSTKDIDLLGIGDPRPDELAAVFQSICNSDVVADDGLDFDAGTVTAQAIREDAVYDGVRVVLRATLGKARIRVQVDVGFGDAVTPAPVRVRYPTLLDQPAPHVSAYPVATVVAEKLEAMVSLGMVNSRMKDFYDVRWCAKNMAFDGGELVRAVIATFGRRATSLPSATPIAFTSEFARDSAKQTQWAAFNRKSQLADPAEELADVVADVSNFLTPVVSCATGGSDLGRWEPGGPWSELPKQIGR